MLHNAVPGLLEKSPVLPCTPAPGSSRGVISLTHWCERAGVSMVTAWRFRRRGWLKTVNIAGRMYVTEEAAHEFVRRAEAGEFAKVPPIERLRRERAY